MRFDPARMVSAAYGGSSSGPADEIVNPVEKLRAVAINPDKAAALYDALYDLMCERAEGMTTQDLILALTWFQAVAMDGLSDLHHREPSEHCREGEDEVTKRVVSVLMDAFTVRCCDVSRTKGAAHAMVLLVQACAEARKRDRERRHNA